ncbi:hypothetical protein EII17_03925 [Clostridiales bacterium COT073_COT-073]|nr:hypothetical protein EII17_03925 [Clostridiales bacterium COT073_COT-073]
MNELIRILQTREDVSFEEAQYYLKKTAGDVDRAVQLIQKRKNSSFRRTTKAIKEGLAGFWKYRVVICRTDRMFVNIPFFVVILLLLLFEMAGVRFVFLSMVVLAGIIFSGSEFNLGKLAAEQTDERWHSSFTQTGKSEVNWQSGTEKAKKQKEEAELTELSPMNSSHQGISSTSEFSDYSEIIIK